MNILFRSLILLWTTSLCCLQSDALSQPGVCNSEKSEVSTDLVPKSSSCTQGRVAGKFLDLKNKLRNTLLNNSVDKSRLLVHLFCGEFARGLVLKSCLPARWILLCMCMCYGYCDEQGRIDNNNDSVTSRKTKQLLAKGWWRLVGQGFSEALVVFGTTACFTQAQWLGSFDSFQACSVANFAITAAQVMSSDKYEDWYIGLGRRFAKKGRGGFVKKVVKYFVPAFCTLGSILALRDTLWNRSCCEYVNLVSTEDGRAVSNKVVRKMIIKYDLSAAELEVRRKKFNQIFGSLKGLVLNLPGGEELVSSVCELEEYVLTTVLLDEDVVRGKFNNLYVKLHPNHSQYNTSERIKQLCAAAADELLLIKKKLLHDEWLEVKVIGIYTEKNPTDVVRFCREMIYTTLSLSKQKCVVEAHTICCY